MTKLKTQNWSTLNSKCDKIEEKKLSDKTLNVTKLKNSKSDKTLNVTKLTKSKCDNSKTQSVEKKLYNSHFCHLKKKLTIQKSNCDKTQKLKLIQN